MFDFRHPYVTFFHLFFRVSAVVIFLFGGIFIQSYITKFVLIVLLLSMDFWTVKNITGKLVRKEEFVLKLNLKK